MAEVAGKDRGIARVRVRVFVDFWNYELSMKDVDAAFQTDWRSLGPVLVDEAARVVGSPGMPEFQGMNVYGSYDEKNPNDERLKRWATTVLDTFPGVHVSLVPRQKKRSGPKCPVCHAVVHSCPTCSADMRGTEEKGVDTRMVTDIMSLAWADNYDVAVLVSADRDFVPVAEFLQTKGIKMIHGAFPPKAAVLTQKCWGSVSIPGLRKSFRRAAPAKKPASRKGKAKSP